jgi:acetylornithine/N-succinyldiaminopimelate aminotransferase
MKPASCIRSPTVLRILLNSGFRTLSSALDYVRLLPNTRDHGSTFGGGPLACRLSLEFIEMLQEQQLMRRVLQVRTYFRKQLRQMQRRHPGLIKEVRGLGLMVGAEMSFPSKSVVTKMLECGFLISCTHDTVLRFLPPYIIKRTEISSMLTNLEEVIVSEAP